MSGKKAKQARQRERAHKAIQGPTTFIPASPPEHLRGRVESALNAGYSASALWSTVSPWLWVEATLPPEHSTGDTPVAVYLSRDYQVTVYDQPGVGGWPGMWHLSFKRKDRQPIEKDRWRICQTIKNTLVGPENEAVELYPAESRLVDTSNQAHMWVLKDPGFKFPFGFNDRLVTATPTGSAEQAPFDPALPYGPTDEDEKHFKEVSGSIKDP